MQANCAPRAECGAASRAGVTVTDPAFVLMGDKIKVSTDSGEYIERGDSPAGRRLAHNSARRPAPVPTRQRGQAR
ncbi:MAG: hypothetical protein EPO19_08190 [Betaproteobacteria bacterium]|nr:MAG: hypothetical protein EPO19_08190 [Betaproteobacteria bacterium]